MIFTVTVLLLHIARSDSGLDRNPRLLPDAEELLGNLGLRDLPVNDAG